MEEWEVVDCRRGEGRGGHLTMTGLYIPRVNPDICRVQIVLDPGFWMMHLHYVGSGSTAP